MCFATGGLAISRAIAIMAIRHAYFPCLPCIPHVSGCLAVLPLPVNVRPAMGTRFGEWSGFSHGRKKLSQASGLCASHRIAPYRIVSPARNHKPRTKPTTCESIIFCSILLNFFLCFFSADRIGRSAGAIEMPDRGESWCVIAFPQGEKERIEISYFVPLRFGPIYLDVL